MAEVIAISLEVDAGKSVQSVKSLEDAIADVQKTTNKSNVKEKFESLNRTIDESGASFDQLNASLNAYKNIALQAGRESAIGKEALKKAGEYKKKIDEIEMEVSNLAVKGQNMQGALQIGTSVMAGYQGFLGITALVGDENEALMETMVKLQAVMSVTQAIEQIRLSTEKESLAMKTLSNAKTKIATALTWLYNGAIAGTTGAMKLFRIALISTGLGALVVLLGVLIANFDKWKDAVLNFIKDSLSPLMDALKWLGIMESDLEKQRRTNHDKEMQRIQERRDALGSLRDKAEQDLKNEIAVANARGENTDKSQKKLLKLTRDNAQKRIDDNNALLEEIESGNRVATEDEYKNTQDSIIADRKLRDGASQDLKVFDATKSKERRDAGKVSSDKKIDTQKKEDERLAKLEEDKQAKLKELQAEFKDLQNEEIENENNRAVTQLETEQQRELDALVLKYGLETELEKQLVINQKAEMDALKEEHRLAKEEQRLLDEKLLTDNKAIINEILRQYDLDSIESTFEKARQELEIQRKADLEKIKLAGATQEQIDKINKVYSDKAKKISDEEAEFKKKLKKAEINQALEASAEVLGSIVSLVGEGSAVGKAAAIAQATISTYLSAQEAYSSMVGIPYVGPVLAPIAAGVAVAAGIANIRKIASTKIPGGGGGGAGSGITPPTFAKPNIDTSTINSRSTNGDGNGDGTIPTSRVVLVESDLRMMQERRNNSEIISTI